jgi:hypothetical protein
VCNRLKLHGITFCQNQNEWNMRLCPEGEEYYENCPSSNGSMFVKLDYNNTQI